MDGHKIGVVIDSDPDGTTLVTVFLHGKGIEMDILTESLVVLNDGKVQTNFRWPLHSMRAYYAKH
jgi:hypothetical protein